MKKLILLITHGIAGFMGFALGIYALPILIAPEAPTTEAIEEQVKAAVFNTTFKRDLKGSDAFHWGEGDVVITDKNIALMGELAPGPDYKLYLAPEFVEDEAEFNRIKSDSVLVSDIKTFKNFLVPLNDGIKPENYTTVVVWCETFGEFITAGKYR